MKILQKGQPRLQTGYTLIEILTSVVIITIIFTVAIANFRDFQRRQQARSLGRELESNLRNAQSLALTGAKPDTPNCNSKTFAGIRVQIDTTTSYSVRALCDSAPVTLKTYTLPSNAVLKYSIPTNKFTFEALGQGTDIASTARIGVCVGSDGYGYKITSTGEISQDTTFSCP